MAKAKPIEGLDCEAPAASMAAIVFQTRFDEMLGFHASAIDPAGVDGVHDMRVASRRLRSALRDFGPLFEKRSLKGVKKQVKKMADALGNVRDHDVAIASLESLKDRSPSVEVSNGLETLIADRRAQRAEAFSEMIVILNLDHLSDLRDDFGKVLISNNGRSIQQTHVEFRHFAVDAVERALKRFLERAESFYDPFDDKALHKLRLAAKRLRYALELFDQCWLGELKPFAKYASRIQSTLGEVHDSSEWIETLAAAIRKTDGIDRHTAAWLISEFVGLRTAEYLKALQLWNEWLASDLTREIRSAMTK